MGRLCYPTRASGQRVVMVSQKTFTVQGGYGALFAVQAQVKLGITRIAVHS